MLARSGFTVYDVLRNLEEADLEMMKVEESLGSTIASY